ncbi:MAG: quinone-dependent dihydroorotate dehydrogenase [Bdellovibrionaceae bacterium]|nr:quinone-dependent dihydroorotate dehydrogenase [Pseudobdellovibrionaceae bacterium]
MPSASTPSAKHPASWNKPWLWLPASWAHFLSPYALKIVGHLSEKTPPAWKSFVWRGLVFRNRLGIAGGVDKDADNLKAWWALGCGFVEVGTVTPFPQEANPGKIMDRDLSSRSLWNKMGFPSAGADEVVPNLRAAKPYLTPVFVNIGKNRQTPNDEAVNDYLSLIQSFAGLADAFVVNISSPNTKGLRDLQNADSLRALLIPLKQEAQRLQTPLLIKLSPDMGAENFQEAVRVADLCGIDGFVLTNTTLSRVDGVPYPAEGGMSGAPLQQLSLQALRLAQEALGARRAEKLIISVGGVMTAADVFERLKLGADLVQTYSALIFEGPGFFRQVAKDPLAKEL